MARAGVTENAVLALMLAATILAGAIVFDASSTLANVVADVFLAATLTVLARTLLLSRDRRRYAREAARALAPLRRQTAPIEAYLSSLVRDAERLSQYRDPDDWYEVYENMWDPFAPWRSEDEETSGRPTHPGPERDAPPARRDDLVAAFEAVRSGYGGPDLSAELAEAAAAVDAAQTVWADLAGRFNAIEALRPPQLFPGLPVSGDAMRDRRAQTAAYRDAFHAAEESFARATRHLRRHRDAVIDLERRLATEYEPERLARRDTPDPFPRWVWRSALAAAAAAAAVWAWLARSGSGQIARDITDNVLVGAAAAATGVALAAIAQRLADERVAREGAPPRRRVVEAIETLRQVADARTSAEQVARIRAAKTQLRTMVHELQHIAPNPRLDIYGDLAVEAVDAWTDAPGPISTGRLRAALDQLEQLVTTLFAAHDDIGPARDAARARASIADLRPVLGIWTCGAVLFGLVLAAWVLLT
jgi:hypothetical protein